MNRILLYNNLFFIKHKYLKYLSVILLAPMLMYSLNILLFSHYYDQDFVWPSIGIWISCPILCSYVYAYDFVSSNILNQRRKVNFIINSYVPTSAILGHIIAVSIFISILSLFCSYLIIYGLVGSSALISGINFFYLTLSMLSVVLFFIPLAIFFALYDMDNIGLSITMLICALIVRFSYFANTEIEHFYNPIFELVRNCSSFILHSSNYAFSYKPILVMASFSIIALILIVFLLNSFINKQYER